MTDNDFFVNEVNTDVREENFSKQLKKYRWVIAAVVLGVVGFVGFGEYASSKKKAEGEAQYSAISNALSGQGDVEILLNSQGSELALFEAASLKVDANDIEGAKAIYSQLSEDGQYSDTAREFAKLQLLSLEGGAEQTPLANPGEPFIVQAKLIEANALVEAGKTDEALIVLEALLENSEAQSERAMIETMILSLGGELPDPLDVAPIESAVSEDEAASNLQEQEAQGQE